MTCILPRPAPQTLWDRIAAMFSANVLGGAPILPNSNEAYVVANDYLAQETFYSISEQQWREQDDRYCCCDNLTTRAAKRGVFPNAASSASGYVIVTGTPGAAISNAMSFTFAGAVYTVDNTQTLPPTLPASGSVTVAVTAAIPGAVGNAINPLSASSVTGLLTNAPAGVNSAVTACGTQFCNGRDAETCEQFRTRYLARQAYKPTGQFAEIVEMIKEWPCVTRVCVRNCDCCVEQYRFELYPMFDGTFANGIAPAQVVADMEEWFFGLTQGLGLGRAPIHTYGRFFVPTAAAVDVTIGGLQCVTSDQLQLVRDRVAGLFSQLCPSATLCLRQIELAVAQVTGDACAIDVVVSSTAAGIMITDCGDIVPDCDVLPIIGAITIPTGAC